MRRHFGTGAACAGLLLCSFTFGQSAFEARVREVMGRPQFRHSRFGLAVYAAEDGRPLYRLNAEQLFVPGSTTKLVTMGSALKLIGADYQFRTALYRTGAISADGTLHGDLVVKPGGDLNLSGRVQADGTLAFQNVDHAYWPTPGAAVVAGDPIAPIRAMARDAASKGIKRVTGQLYVDVSLFPAGDRELGSGVALSPIVVNDNVLDMFVGPGAQAGDRPLVRLSPDTAFVRITNRMTTGAAGGAMEVRVVSDEKREDGGRQIVLEGSVPLGHEPSLRVYKMTDPVPYARFVFRESLEQAGVVFESPMTDANPAVAWDALYTPDRLLAEHLSPPFVEDAKFTLKVSQNLHASTAPYLVGAIVGGKHGEAIEEGFRLERKMLEGAGLDLSGAVQTDGAGGSALFTPDFMCSYLRWMAGQTFFPRLKPGLPVLGVDGTLWDIQTKSPAAGKVFAKTGTYASEDLLHEALVITGKGLAGYMTTRDGHRVVIAFYVNFVPGDPGTVTHMAGETLGELATGVWESEWK